MLDFLFTVVSLAFPVHPLHSSTIMPHWPCLLFLDLPRSQHSSFRSITISHFYFTSHAILFLVLTMGPATFVWAWIRWCPAHQLLSIPVLGSCHQPISATHQICTGWQQSSERLDGDRNYFSDELVSSLALVFDCGGWKEKPQQGFLLEQYDKYTVLLHVGM